MHTFKQALAVIWLCALAGAAAYYFFFSQPDPAHVSIPDYPPGWEALASCERAMSSLDERKFLTLGEDHRASVEDHSASEIKFVEGRWAYDAPSKRYAITLDGQTTTYSLLVKGEPTTCILLKGDPGAADLRASWFSSPSDDNPLDYEYKGPSPPNP